MTAVGAFAWAAGGAAEPAPPAGGPAGGDAPATPTGGPAARAPAVKRLAPAVRRRARAGAPRAEIRWRRSAAVGRPDAGRLVRGVALPREGEHHVTWDPIRWRSPNRAGRLHATDRLLRVLLRVAREHTAAHPGAARIAVGDLSRRHGGDFGKSMGALGEFGARGAAEGHLSHQNGLDVDVYYPRRDREERAPDSLGDIDRRLSQDLVDRFVAAGAQLVFVGPRTGLTGPPGVVQPLARHDDHLHVRLPPG